MKSGIRDNHHRGTVGEFLKQQIQSGTHLSIVSAYFTIYAYEALQQQLDGVKELRFLFGDPTFLRNIDPERQERKAFQIEADEIALQNRLQQKRLARACRDWIVQKVQIRSVKRAGLLHGKLYHIADGRVQSAILGSSNFTVRGLGLSKGRSNNLELNMVVDSDRDREDLRQWFDELWDDASLVTDVRDEVLNYLQQVYANHAPEFIYFKTLFHLFEHHLDEQRRGDVLTQQSQIVDTDIWNALFAFQRDGVKGAITRMLRHNGCIIADSVGLGKTYEALAVIKYFELRNDKVLVLCPKKLRDNWTVYQAQNNTPLNPFIRDRFSYTVLSHTDLSRDGGKSGDIDLSLVNWGNYDLVVIDESHNFRNNATGRRDEQGEVIRKTRYQRLMEDIIASGLKTKVLLLSATPVNNDLKDLRNQLLFLTEGKDDAFRESLGIVSLKETLATAQRVFSEWAKKERRTSDELLERLSGAFFTLLDELTIARSRQHIQQYYHDTISELGGFPERQKPISLYPEIDLRRRFLSYDRLNDEIMQYRLSLYNPSRYVLAEHQQRYERDNVRNFSQIQREKYLIGMMKVNFLKRLESSIAAFALTMEKTITKIEELERKIVKFQERPTQKATVAAEEFPFDAIDPEDEELRDALTVGRALQFQLAHLDLDAWLRDLRHDKQQLDLLLSSALGVRPEHDAKLHELRQMIQQKVTNPPLNKRGEHNRKVLVFTAFADTAKYLYGALHDWARDDLGVHVALVTGQPSENRATLGKNEFNQILTNFSPVSKRRAQLDRLPQHEQIDLLVATDCISEGQNLQDCDMVVNYDIHWNPVRIIQRFGRIDRIGSLNERVQLVNFWPTNDLNKYINLRGRVEARMALVDLTATGDDNLLDADTLKDVVKGDINYRDRQLLRLKNEVLDLEDFGETVALTDFSLDDFRIDLSKFLEQNREQLRKEPIGLYAVVDHRWSRHEQVKPGVIFCLRLRNPADTSQMINPLQPFYLVYIRQDGTVRYGFAQPKQTLEIFRDLCIGRSKADEDLCALFDRETDDGSAMQAYSALLFKAIDESNRQSTKRSAQAIQLGRNAVLPAETTSSRRADEFDLVTWLVIR